MPDPRLRHGNKNGKNIGNQLRRVLTHAHLFHDNQDKPQIIQQYLYEYMHGHGNKYATLNKIRITRNQNPETPDHLTLAPLIRDAISQMVLKIRPANSFETGNTTQNYTCPTCKQNLTTKRGRKYHQKRNIKGRPLISANYSERILCPNDSCRCRCATQKKLERHLFFRCRPDNAIRELNMIEMGKRQIRTK